uniref:Uncharacterized protein n=1 Tax=Oryza glumipatula TaxID=40148 RepID=A0A0E0ADD8_9ORYZ
MVMVDLARRRLAMGWTGGGQREGWQRPQLLRIWWLLVAIDLVPDLKKLKKELTERKNNRLGCCENILFPLNGNAPPHRRRSLKTRDRIYKYKSFQRKMWMMKSQALEQQQMGSEASMEAPRALIRLNNFSESNQYEALSLRFEAAQWGFALAKILEKQFDLQEGKHQLEVDLMEIVQKAQARIKPKRRPCRCEARLHSPCLHSAHSFVLYAGPRRGGPIISLISLSPTQPFSRGGGGGGDEEEEETRRGGGQWGDEKSKARVPHGEFGRREDDDDDDEMGLIAKSGPCGPANQAHTEVSNMVALFRN